MLCSSATFPGKAAATAEKLIPLFPRQRSPFYSRRGQNHDQKMSRIHFPGRPRPPDQSSPAAPMRPCPPALSNNHISQSRCSFLIMSLLVGVPLKGLHFTTTTYIHGYRCGCRSCQERQFLHSASCQLEDAVLHCHRLILFGITSDTRSSRRSATCIFIDFNFNFGYVDS